MTDKPNHEPVDNFSNLPEDVAAFERRVTSAIRELSKAAEQLRSIRATLLVNFGDTQYNHHGFTIEDKGSTHDLMYRVLDKLTVRVAAAEKPAPVA